MSIKDGGPAFPIADQYSSHPATMDEAKRFAKGMSLRDYLIAHLPLEDEAGDFVQDVKASILGRRPPNGDWVDVLQFEADFRAKWKAMQADAILRVRGGSC